MIKLIKKKIKKLIRKYKKVKQEEVATLRRKVLFSNLMTLDKDFWRYLKSQEIKQ